MSDLPSAPARGDAARPVPPTRGEASRPTPKPGILDISPYVGGKAKAVGFDHPLKLSSNENVLGCSPKARAAYAAAADRLQMYPDGKAGPLRAAVAAEFGLEPERLVFGCGSDEIFALLNQVFLEPGDNIVQGQHGFLAYRISARAMQAEVRFAPERNLTVDVDAMLDCVDDRTRIVFLANPANPTGTVVMGEAVRRLHAALPPSVVLVLDGAYAEFVEDPAFDDGLDLARTSENIVVTRTFSKLHGLASLRVGWGYAPAAIADAMERIRAPFNLNIPGIEAAVAALGDRAFQDETLALMRRWRPWLQQQLGGLGLETTASHANFVLARFPDASGGEGGRTAAAAEQHLASHGVLVRGVAGYGLPDHLRITVGREADNRRVVAALAEFMGRADQAA